MHILHALRNPIVWTVVAWLFCLLHVFLTLSPHITHSSYRFSAEEKYKPFTYPTIHTEAKRSADVRIAFQLPRLHPTKLRFTTYECIRSLRINNVDVAHPALTTCQRNTSLVFDLRAYLQPGENLLEATVVNASYPAQMQMRIPFWDTTLLSALLIVNGCFVALLSVLLKRRHLMQTGKMLIGIFVFGTLLRLTYFLTTPYWIRGFDVLGHQFYLQYVLQHWSMPPAQAGWETYQPPLYYAVNAFLLLPAKLLGANAMQLLDIAQFHSFLFTSGALALALWIGHMLFPEHTQKKELCGFGVMIAALPGLIYSSSQISNDVLMQLLAFAYFGLLLRWWIGGKIANWYASIVILGLALITKSNAIPFVAIGAICFALRRRAPGKSITRTALISLLLLSVISGGYYVQRFVIEGERNLVGNLAKNPPGLTIDVGLRNFIEFRPLQVLRAPLVDNWVDGFGRHHMWEYLLKSAFTGELYFGPVGLNILRMLYILNFFLLPLALFAALADIRKKRMEYAPLWITAVLSCASIVGMVIIGRIGGFQDFRYVHILAIPVTFYVIRGLQMLPKSPREMLLLSYPLLFAILCTSYVLLLALVKPATNEFLGLRSSALLRQREQQQSELVPTPPLREEP